MRRMRYSILNNLILNAGARYDYFSTFGDTLNPRAALIYKPWTNSVFKAIYGQAFRAPSAYEMYYVAPGYASNTQLRPETIRSYELVYEQTIIPQVRWTGSVFYNDIHHLISFGTNAAGTSVFGNIDSATSLGGEAELDGHWGGVAHPRELRLCGREGRKHRPAPQQLPGARGQAEPDGTSLA